ncbi:MAG: twin-arginine translocase TatA/TatE family subunit, partial [Bacteroidales bacterium]|nr:twin-arginine translocase TatA/TatE family subunit [Bacteroidales bacterium]
IILIVVIIIFGPTQIPKLTKMFGKSVKGFKEGMAEEEEELAAEKKAKKTAAKKVEEVASEYEKEE